MFTAADAQRAITDTETAFREMRDQLAAWRVERSSKIIDEIDWQLDHASAAFRARSFDKAEEILFEVKMAIRKIAVEQRADGTEHFDQMAAALDAKLGLTISVLSEILTQTEALTQRALRKTAKKHLPVIQEGLECVPRSRETLSLRLAWFVAAVSTVVALVLLARTLR